MGELMGFDLKQHEALQQADCSKTKSTKNSSPSKMQPFLPGHERKAVA